MKIIASLAFVIFLALTARAGSLTAAEIGQIEAEFGMTLSSNEITKLSAVVYPTNSAQWRSDAYGRIDTHRKAELGIQVVDMNGDPVEGAQVDVKLKRNDFKFGGTFSAKDFDGVTLPPTMTTSTYKERLLSMFNAVGLNNGFKPRLTGIHPYLPAVKSWAAANDLPIRGHLLIWPGNTNNNHLTSAVLADVEAVEAALTNGSSQAVIDGLRDDLKLTIKTEMEAWASQHDVYEWDVINEPLGNHRVQDALDDYDVMADWFEIAESNKVSADCKLLINEYQIISAMSSNRSENSYINRRDGYMAEIDRLIANNAPLNRIGFQSRIKLERREPQLIYDRLEEWGNAYGLEMAGTEFEVVDSDPGDWMEYIYTEEERSQITEEMMTQYFSHPLVTGFNAWNAINDDTEALVDYAGRPTIHGLVWYYLHRIRFNTDATLASGLDGRTGLRAFKGEYDITVTYQGQEYASALSLTNDESVVFSLVSSVADDPNTSEVVDAWHYDGLTNGAGLAQGVSTGVVGGVFFNNNALASIGNGTVRWRSDGVADSMYQGKDSSSYDGASNGLFQLSVDFLDADFTATSALSNGTGRVNYGIKDGSGNDAYFRLTFVSGGGSNAQYRLEVKDALNNNLNVASFSGTTLDHLAVRAVYDLAASGSAGSFKVYYRKNGASEVLAHTGQLVAGFALDQLRAVVQTYNGGANWAAGDQLFTDNLVLRKLGDPPPPPSETVIDGWYFDGLANGAGLSEALSVGAVGGAAFGDDAIVSISNNATRWAWDGADPSAFKTTAPSSQAGATSGLFQVGWDYVSADFANTDAADGSANIGFGIRSEADGNQDAAFRLRYDGTANEFLLQLTDANGANQTLATFAGNQLTNLSVRMVLDLDSRGAAGSLKLFYTPNGGGEMAGTVAGMLHPLFRIDLLRYAVQTTNGGTAWALGDAAITDNLVFSLLTATATPASLYEDWLADYPSVGSTNIEDNLLFYAFGANPTNPATTGNWPEYQVVEGGLEYVHYERNDAEARGLGYVVETTGDLSGSWTNGGFVFVGAGGSGAAFNVVTNRLPVAAGAGFIRVNVEYNP